MIIMAALNLSFCMYVCVCACVCACMCVSTACCETASTSLWHLHFIPLFSDQKVANEEAPLPPQ